MTENHFDLSDADFEARFAACTLPVADFTHRAHLRLAWLHLRKDGLPRAEANILAQLQAFVTHAGAAGKYDQALTRAAVRAVHHYMQQSKAGNFTDFLAENPVLIVNFREICSEYLP